MGKGDQVPDKFKFELTRRTEKLEDEGGAKRKKKEPKNVKETEPENVGLIVQRMWDEIYGERNDNKTGVPNR